MRVDMTAQDIGLEKGELTNNQIAEQVVREFFEALIAKDYAKAGSLCGGLPGEGVKQMLGSVDYLRIISIGQPYPDADPRTEFVRVPCEVQISANGKPGSKKFDLGVRPIYGQPNRWAIQGGI